MTKSRLVDSGFVVPVFSLGDDLIACLKKAMVFLTAVASLRFVVVKKRLMVFLDLKLRLFLRHDLKTSLKKERTAKEERSTAKEEMTRSTRRKNELDWETDELNPCEMSRKRLRVLIGKVKDGYQYWIW
nr:hypothetical protein [Tanacetum cinerariifolium]